MKHQEIERKWLMQKFPPLVPEQSMDTWQGYLSFAPVVRIRRRRRMEGEDFRLTIKGEGTLQRTEVELPLDEGQFEALCGLLKTPLVHKLYKTYTLPGGETLECSHVNATAPDAFFYAEVEFESAEAATAFRPPAFLGREVTEEPGYTMAAYCKKQQEKAQTP